MNVIPLLSASDQRGARMLRTALGPDIATWLDDPDIVEIMLNPDGHLWTDSYADGLKDSGVTMSAQTAERIIRLAVFSVGIVAHNGSVRGQSP